MSIEGLDQPAHDCSLIMALTALTVCHECGKCPSFSNIKMFLTKWLIQKQ